MPPTRESFKLVISLFHAAFPDLHQIHIARIANGQLVEHWDQEDDLALMQQLGAIPAPTPGG